MNILVACNTGMVSSTIIRYKVEELLNNHNISYTIDQCRLDNVKDHIEGVDLFLPAIETKNYDVETIITTNYLLEKNEEELDQKILKAIKKHA